MEDAYFYKELGEHYCWGICDGHGDEGLIAKLASKMIPERFFAFLDLNSSSIEEVFPQVLQSVQEKTRQEKIKGGSTALINYLDRKTGDLYVATLGDSETRLCTSDSSRFVNCSCLPGQRTWKMQPLSVVCDWSTPEDEARALRFAEDSAEQVKEIWAKMKVGKERRFPPVGGCNVSRALGHLSDANKQGESLFSIVPTVTKQPLKPGNVVVSASDGLWDYMPQRSIEMLVESDSQEPFSSLAQKLGQFALMKSQDNVSIIVVKV